MTIITFVGFFLLAAAAFSAGMAVAIEACRRGAPADLQTRHGAVELMVLALVCAAVVFAPWPWLFGWGSWLLDRLAKVW